MLAVAFKVLSNGGEKLFKIKFVIPDVRIVQDKDLVTEVRNC